MDLTDRLREGDGDGLREAADMLDAIDAALADVRAGRIYDATFVFIVKHILHPENGQ